ncbi:sensor histidine kinase [Actinomadura rudentiformis]|uniref:sensor histidine kinase n=1 Tax=Actinomadura rudentiformis TaxID=359158 RepID=UPI001CEF5D5C|nr:ATP-binding protein [Actinomadura rudentiformis]
MTRLSVRARLTLVYGSLFLVTSAILVGVTYLQTVKAMDKRFDVRFQTEKTPAIRSLQGLDQLPRAQQFERLATARGEIQAEVAKRLQEQKQEVLEQMLQSTMVTLLFLGLAGIGIGYLVAGRTLRPIHTVTATAQRLSESNLHERIALTGPQDEIKDLADTFDRMLDRLHRAFDAQRRFVANASHELRTPLTINRTVLEVAIASRKNPPETKALADVLLGNTARHERLINGLLLLARSERELNAPTPTPLEDVVRSAVDHLDELAGETDVDVTVEVAPATTVGDPVLLERCAVNLLENALKYNVPGGQVWVRTWRRRDQVMLRVENTGRPVPSYELATIYEPFRRLGADRIGSADGAGLGLSIVRAVVRAHGGTLDTVSRPDGGLAITVRLPAAPAAALPQAR